VAHLSVVHPRRLTARGRAEQAGHKPSCHSVCCRTSGCPAACRARRPSVPAPRPAAAKPEASPRNSMSRTHAHSARHVSCSGQSWLDLLAPLGSVPETSSAPVAVDQVVATGQDVDLRARCAALLCLALSPLTRRFSERVHATLRPVIHGRMPCHAAMARLSSFTAQAHSSMLWIPIARLPRGFATTFACREARLKVGDVLCWLGEAQPQHQPQSRCSGFLFLGVRRRGVRAAMAPGRARGRAGRTR
jgi:hypothetical protein